MKKKLFTSALAMLCICGTVSAQDTIEWTVMQNSLSGTVGGVQMHGTAALDINGQTYLYAFGGNRGVDGGDSARANYTTLDLDPLAIGTWADTTFTFDLTPETNLPIASQYMERTTIVYNGRIYLVGGAFNAPGSQSLNGIRVFEPETSGDLLAPNAALGFDGAAAGVTPSLGSGGNSAVVNPATGDLYVFGGSTDLGVRQFKIDSTTGAVSDYVYHANLLVYPAFFSSGAVIKDGYVYIIDAHTEADRTKVQFAPINPDGTLGAFTQTASLPSAHIDGGSAVLNGEIYAVGGHTGPGNGATSNAVHRSVTGANGQITEWVADASFPHADIAPTTPGLRRMGVASLGNDGFVIVGGRNGELFPEHVWVATPVDSNVDEWSLY